MDRLYCPDVEDSYPIEAGKNWKSCDLCGHVKGDIIRDWMDHYLLEYDEPNGTPTYIQFVYFVRCPVDGHYDYNELVHWSHECNCGFLVDDLALNPDFDMKGHTVHEAKYSFHKFSEEEAAFKKLTDNPEAHFV